MTDAMNLHNYPARDEAAESAHLDRSQRLVPRYEPIGTLGKGGGGEVCVD